MVNPVKNMFQRASVIFHSIRFRLTLYFVLFLGVVILAFSAFIYYNQAQELRNAAIVRLEYKAQKITGLLHSSDQETLQPTPLQAPGVSVSGDAFLQEGDVLAFIASNGQTIQNWGPIDANGIRQLVDRVLKTETAGQTFSSMAVSATVAGQDTRTEYVFVIDPISHDGIQTGSILIGTPVDPGEQLPRLFLSLLLGILATMAVAFVGGYWLADRAMHPVKVISDAAQKIGETDLSLRLNIQTKDELGQLADTFNGMLARLQSAFERQRQFTADASHELRTPLTIIDLEASRALAAHRSPQEYQRAMQVIQSENRFMIRMANNLLTLARMDAGQVVLQREGLDLSDIALEVVERLAPLAVKNQVRLAAGDLPELTISGDRQYLVQMLTNLVENAIKYTEGEDKRVLVVTGARISGNDKQAWVRIIDNGPGISTEHRQNLFDRFYQVDKARHRLERDDLPENEQVTSGTGLGLSIAQWIAHAHGGTIRLDSTLGEGSTFEVSLPLASVPLSSDPTN